MSRTYKVLFASSFVIALLFVFPQWLNKSTAAESAAATASTLSYVLEWDWDEATTLADNAGWQVSNDLGYTITVTEGYLITYSIELIPCNNDFSNDPLGTLYDAIMPGSASAGHGEESDPSRLTVPIVESLTDPQSISTQPLDLTGTTYCWGHYLIGSNAASENYDATNNEASLYLAGSYQSPGATDAVPFEIEADIAWGNIVEITESGSAIELVTAGKHVTVSVQRELGSMFDGIDFEEMGESEQARSVLRNLANTVSLTTTH